MSLSGSCGCSWDQGLGLRLSWGLGALRKLLGLPRHADRKIEKDLLKHSEAQCIVDFTEDPAQEGDYDPNQKQVAGNSSESQSGSCGDNRDAAESIASRHWHQLREPGLGDPNTVSAPYYSRVYIGFILG